MTIPGGQASDLLSMLHAMVMSDAAPSGISGTVAFGVRINDAEVWWRAELDGGRPKAEFVSGAPADAEVTLLMGEWAAEGLLREGVLPDPPGLLRLEGDGELLTSFVRRYLEKKSSLDVRRAVAGTSGQKTKRRR